jgi:hypothetical protein
MTTLTRDNAYLTVLQGKHITIDNYYGFYLSLDGEFIRVQGAGSWANKSDDKKSFLEDFDKLLAREAHGDINNMVVA